MPLFRKRPALVNYLVVAAASIGCYIAGGFGVWKSHFEVNGKGVDGARAAASLIAEEANASLAEAFPKLREPPRVVKVVAPSMSKPAIAAGLQGQVVAEMSVDTDGRVEAVRIVGTPSTVLSDPVVAALSQWVFEPLVVDGAAKPFKVCQTFDYRT